MFDFAGKFFLYLRRKLKRVRGSAMVEFALTLPMVLALIFFLIEVLRMKDVRTAIDGMVGECSVQFMFSKSTDDGGFTFDKIIEKYRPSYISKKDITYYFTIFDSAEDLYKDNATFSAYWPKSESSSQQIGGAGKKLKLKNYKKPEFGLASGSSSKGFLNGKAFVLTFVLRYKFANGWIAKMLKIATSPQAGGGTGGTNTGGNVSSGSGSSSESEDTSSSGSARQNTSASSSDSAGQSASASSSGSAGQNTSASSGSNTNTSSTPDIYEDSLLMWSRAVGFCR